MAATIEDIGIVDGGQTEIAAVGGTPAFMQAALGISDIGAGHEVVGDHSAAVVAGLSQDGYRGR